VLARGDQVLVSTPGGGGYGPAAERDPKLAKRDRVMGYGASRQRARPSARDRASDPGS
jgi:N-methylhydantoinase B/oxoprolinase/acetone carboxylase alpha subunit